MANSVHGTWPVVARGQVRDGEALAQRFRPYYKFSIVQNAQEPCRPCSWQWFAAHSRLMNGDAVLIKPDQLMADPMRILSVAQADLRTTQTPTDVLMLRPDQAAWEGEPWPAVIDTGTGLYCQCEDAGNGLVVLTYWTLFAYNKTTIRGDHEGDIIAVVTVYDRKADRLIRATFGMHGRVLESFDLPSPTAASQMTLHGQNPDGNDESPTAETLHIPADHRYQNGPIYYTPSKPADAYFMKDPDTGRFEHLAIFCEWGSHEPWPNPHGSFALAPNHAGLGVSFLPKRIRYLGSFANPTRAEAAIVYFDGRWGTAAAGFAFHRACFYPEGREHNRFHIPQNAFADRDPFKEGPLQWPPFDLEETAR